MVLDPTKEEELVCEGFIYLAINETGDLIYFSKQGKSDLEAETLKLLIDKIQSED